MKTCAVCSHESRSKIESAMLRGENLSALARQYNLTKDSVHNHKNNHLPSGIAQAIMKNDALIRFDLFNELESMLDIAKDVVKRNNDKKNDSITIKALAESRSVIETLTRVLQTVLQIKTMELELNKDPDSEYQQELLAEEAIKMLKVFNIPELEMYQKLQDKLLNQTDNVVIPETEQFNFGKPRRRKSRIQR